MSGKDAAKKLVTTGDAAGLRNFLAGHAPGERRTLAGSLLHVACGTGHEEVVRVLLDEGAGVNELKHTRVRPRLVTDIGEKKASLTTIPQESPLEIAATKAQFGVVEVLIARGADVALVFSSGATPLQQACLMKSMPLALSLLRHSADVNQRHPETQKTALFYAAEAGCEALVDVLLLHGAAVDWRDSSGNDVLSATCSSKACTTGVMGALLKGGADPNAVNPRNGNCVLHMAVFEGRLDLAELLLLHGARVNARSLKGFTPLHVAAFRNSLAASQLLLSNGADPAALSRANFLPQDLAKDPEVLALLRRRHGAAISLPRVLHSGPLVTRRMTDSGMVERSDNKSTDELLTVESGVDGGVWVADEAAILKQPAGFPSFLRKLKDANVWILLLMDEMMYKAAFTLRQFQQLFQEVAVHHTLTHLVLRVPGITDLVGAVMATMLRKGGQLVLLELGCPRARCNSCMTENGAVALASALESNTTLTCLRIKGHELKSEGGLAFAKMLRVNKHLEELDLSRCRIGEPGLLKIGDALLTNTTLQSVALETSSKCAFALLRVLQDRAGFKRLALEGCSFGCMDEAAGIRLATSLPPFLTVLDIRNNRLRCSGATQLASALKTHQCLRLLNVATNKIRNDGAMAFAQLLRGNPTICELDFSGNSMFGDAAMAFAEAVQHNRRLRVLKLSGCLLSLKVMEALFSGLQNNAFLCALHLDGNHVDSDAMESAVALVGGNSCLCSVGDISRISDTLARNSVRTDLLRTAVSQGKPEEVVTLLRDGVNVWPLNPDDVNVLLLALDHGQWEVLEILLRAPQCDGLLDWRNEWRRNARVEIEQALQQGGSDKFRRSVASMLGAPRPVATLPRPDPAAVVAAAVPMTPPAAMAVATATAAAVAAEPVGLLSPQSLGTPSAFLRTCLESQTRIARVEANVARVVSVAKALDAALGDTNGVNVFGQLRAKKEELVREMDRLTHLESPLTLADAGSDVLKEARAALVEQLQTESVNQVRLCEAALRSALEMDKALQMVRATVGTVVHSTARPMHEYEEAKSQVAGAAQALAECKKSWEQALRDVISSQRSVDVGMSAALAAAAGARLTEAEASSLAKDEAALASAVSTWQQLGGRLSALLRGIDGDVASLEASIGDLVSQGLKSTQLEIEWLRDWIGELQRTRELLVDRQKAGEVLVGVMKRFQEALARVTESEEDVLVLQIQAKREKASAEDLRAGLLKLDEARAEHASCVTELQAMEAAGFSEAGRLLGQSQGAAEQRINSDLVIYTNRELGVGATSKVVEGQSASRGAVAVKIIAANFKKQVASEVAALRSLDEHPNVVSFYAMYETPLNVFLVLYKCVTDVSRLFDTNLSAEQLAVQKLCLADRAGLIRQVCRGVSHIHKTMRFVHRDLKPANILIDHLGVAKISDLGVARDGNFGSDAGSRGFSTAVAVGTMGWRAPEVISGLRRERSPAADVFGLGLIAFFVFSGGFHPFGLFPEDREKNILDVRYEPAPLADPLQQLFVGRCICRDPKLRLVELCDEPLFWSAEDSLDYLKTLWERVPKESLMALDAKGWKDVIEPEMIEIAGLAVREYGDSLWDNLRFVRNVSEHAVRPLERSASVLQRILALDRPPSRADVWKYLRQKYPSLLLRCYEAFGRQ